jgi:hypothetical protein
MRVELPPSLAARRLVGEQNSGEANSAARWRRECSISFRSAMSDARSSRCMHGRRPKRADLLCCWPGVLAGLPHAHSYTHTWQALHQGRKHARSVPGAWSRRGRATDTGPRPCGDGFACLCVRVLRCGFWCAATCAACPVLSCPHGAAVTD